MASSGTRRVVEVRFTATRSSGEVSAVLLLPEKAHCLYVMGHGAGAGMRHTFMESAAGHLAEQGVATFRYQFPYMEHGLRRPDPPSVLLATVRAAVLAAAESVPGLPLLAGGKSMGGRMTSMAAATEPLPGVRGLVFLGFPLHPAGEPSVERAEHLRGVRLPMLFLQGTRDKLASLQLLRPVCADLGADLHVVEDADHSFHVPRRSGKTDEDVLRDLAVRLSLFASKLGG